eukprot:jgi/Ulvmu1/439/UM001_0446.1
MEMDIRRSVAFLAAANDWDIAKPTSWSTHRLGSISTGTYARRDDDAEDDRSHNQLCKGQVGSCQSTCHSGVDSDLSLRKRSFSQLRGLYSQNGALTSLPYQDPPVRPGISMGDDLRGSVRALCLEDLMRNPRHHRKQVRATLAETLAMEAHNAQCTVTELASKLAFDLHCGLPGKVRRIVFGHDNSAILDHAFLYVHLGIHLFCLSTRVRCIVQSAQSAQTEDPELQSLRGRFPSVWRQPVVEADTAVPLLQALLAYQAAQGRLPGDCSCDELLAQPPAQPCMMHNLQGVISHHARHMSTSGLEAVQAKLAHLLKLLEPIASQRTQHTAHSTAQQSVAHTASQLAVDLRWAKKCAEEMLAEPEVARSCTMCSAMSRDPEDMQAELQRLNAAMELAVTEFTVVQHMTASLNPHLYYTTAATMTSLLNMPAADAGVVNAQVYKALSLDKRQATAYLSLVSEHSSNLAAQWARLEDAARTELTDPCLLATPCAASIVRELLGAQELVNAYEHTYNISLPALDIPPIVEPKERPQRVSIAGRVPAQLRLRAPSASTSPAPSSVGGLQRSPTPQGLPTAGHRVSTGALPMGAEPQHASYAMQRSLSDSTSSRHPQQRVSHGQVSRQAAQQWNRALSEMELHDLERLVGDTMQPGHPMSHVGHPASQPQLRTGLSLDAAAHEGPPEQRGGLPKRRRTDTAGMLGELGPRIPGELTPAQFQELQAAAAAAVAGTGGASAHEELLRPPSAGAGAGPHDPALEGQGMGLLRQLTGLVDLDRIQIEIAAQDARLMSQVLLEVLTPWQAASYLTEAFPYLADRHGMADLVKADLKIKRILGQ